MLYILIFTLGIIIGSFLNVCIYRIPKGESVNWPPSHCNNCDKRLKWNDLIPLFSYLSLRGKCRYCGGSISPQYPFVELLNGIIYLIIFYYFGLSLDFVFYSIILSILIVISFIDYRHQIIPDGLVLSIIICSIIYKAILYFLYKEPIYLFDNFIGFTVAGILFLLIALLSKGAMGGGDIKLIASLGFILGLKNIILNILLSFIIGALISVFLLLSGKKGRKDPIPFGPFINISFMVTLLFGHKIISFYIRQFIM